MSDRLSVFRQKCQKDLICLPTTNRVGVAKMQANPPPPKQLIFPVNFLTDISEDFDIRGYPGGGLKSRTEFGKHTFKRLQSNV